MNTPPPDRTDAPLVHRIEQFYQDIYALGKRIPKRDKFGIHARIENLCVEMMELAVAAAVGAKDDKMPPLKKLRVKAEVAKHLIRSMRTAGIIEEKVYIGLSGALQEISKMTNGWLKYLENKEGP